MQNIIKRKNIDMEKVYKYLTCAFLILMVIWRIPFLNKGIDYSDTGFNMTNYRDFFKDLSDNGIGMFFTNFLGAVIYNVLPSHQLLVFRIIHLMMWSGTFLLIYFTFRKPNSSLFNVALSALLLAASSYQKIGEAMYSYYPFSMLLVAVATYLMYTALTRDKKLRLFMGGVVFGLSVGVRLPNVLFFALVAAVFWYYFCQKDVKKGFVRSGIMLGGAFAGLAVMMAFELSVIGPSAILGSANSYSKLASSSSQDHGIINQILHIFEQFYGGILAIIVYVAPVVAAGIAFVLIYKVVLKKHKDKPLYMLFMYLGIALIACVWVIIRGVISSTRFVHIFGMIALVFGSISVFAFMRKQPHLSTAAVIGIISAGCIIVGTDLGITRFADVLPQLCVLMLISVAYIVPTAFEHKTKFTSNITLCYSSISKVLFTVVFVLTVANAAINLIPGTYCDAEYSKLTTTISDEIPVLSGMKTTPERAESFYNLKRVMTENELVKDKEVVAVGMFPLVFNMIDNENYFSSPCVDYNSVSAASINAHYEYKKEQVIRPVVVISRVNMLQFDMEKYSDDEEKIAVIDRMISESEYELIFSDTYFDVWAPTE